MNPLSPLNQLMENLPQTGRVDWIGLRPERRAPTKEVTSANAIAGKGLEGDHFTGRLNAKRQVTLIQLEHLTAIGSFLDRGPIPPQDVRRNIAVAGINLLALKGKRFHIGDVILEYSGPCDPCSRMEEVLGPGGYNAMRGHGGITARILHSGTLHIDDPVRIIAD